MLSKIVNVLAIAWLALASGCEKGDAKARLPAKSDQPEPAASSPAAAGEAGSTAPALAQGRVEESLLKLSGTTEPRRRSTLQSKISGVVFAVQVKEGDRVRKNDVLVSLEQEDFVLRKRQAVASRNAAKAQFDSARLTFDRMSALLKEKTIPQSQFDLAQAGFEGAKAGLEVAEATQAMADKALADSQVRAPYDGVIVRKLITEGEYAAVMPPTPLVVIEEVGVLTLRVQVPEIHMQAVHQGDEVGVRFTAFNQEQKAKVDRVIPSLNPLTRSFSVLIEIPNAKHEFRPGMFAEVTLTPQKLPAGK